MYISYNMGFDDNCNTGLVLGLGGFNDYHNHQEKKKNINKVIPLKSDHHYLFPSDLTLGPSSAEINVCRTASAPGKIIDLPQDLQQQQQQRASSPSTTAISSFSNSNSVKKEREFEEVEVERGSSRVISDEDEEGSPRKKLRLRKEQSAVLEDSFREQSTLNPKQKQALADQLNLRPRQVEVWFQNRRARTKLKQTEVDCELLKKCCETLTEENKRLQRELQELKSLKMNDSTTAPFYMQRPPATLALCPSCERIATGTAGGDASSKTDFSIGPTPPHHFYNPFSHPSAAC